MEYVIKQELSRVRQRSENSHGATFNPCAILVLTHVERQYSFLQEKKKKNKDEHFSLDREAVFHF